MPAGWWKPYRPIRGLNELYQLIPTRTAPISNVAPNQLARNEPLVNNRNVCATEVHAPAPTRANLIPTVTAYTATGRIVQVGGSTEQNSDSDSIPGLQSISSRESPPNPPNAQSRDNSEEIATQSNSDGDYQIVDMEVDSCDEVSPSNFIKQKVRELLTNLKPFVTQRENDQEVSTTAEHLNKPHQTPPNTPASTPIDLRGPLPIANINRATQNDTGQRAYSHTPFEHQFVGTHSSADKLSKKPRVNLIVNKFHSREPSFYEVEDIAKVVHCLKNNQCRRLSHPPQCTRGMLRETRELFNRLPHQNK